MSISTRTGDDGTTALMYNRRVSKCDPRVEACGSVDELNAALGLARASVEQPWMGEQILGIQGDLIVLMGELATTREDLPRYLKDGFSVVTEDLTHKLDDLVRKLEAQQLSFKGWATPGASLNSAALDIARVNCRRAERKIVALQENGSLENREIVVYLNRLSDALWLLARWVETRTGAEGGMVLV